MTVRKLLIGVLAAFGVALLAAPSARADLPVLSNTDLGDYYGNTPLAQSFTTGPEAVTLANIRLRAGSSLLGDLTVEIWRDNQGPGATYCGLEPEEEYSHFPNTHVFVNENCVLAANTTYWLLVNAGDLVLDDGNQRRVYRLASGSTSSYGWSLGETRYWNYDTGLWEVNTPSPWLEIVPETLPRVVPPPPPVVKKAPVDTRSAACRARQAAAERDFPRPYYNVIVHCD